MGKVKDFIVADFSGGIRNDKSDLVKDKNEFVRIINFDIDESGRAKKRLGSHQLGDTFTLGSTGDSIFGAYIDNSVYFERNVLGTGKTFWHLINDNTGNSTCKIYQLVGRRLSAAITTTSDTIDLEVIDSGNEPDFSSPSGTIEIEGDLIAYTGKSTNQLTGVTGIIRSHPIDAAVHQLKLLDSTNTPDGRLGIYYAVLNNTLVINGYLGSSTFDGTNVTVISDANEPAGLFATTYRQRIYVAGSGAVDSSGTRNGSTVRISFCEAGDPTDWGDYTVNYFDVEDSIGESITGLKVSPSDEMLIFKTNSFFAYDEVSLRQRSNTVGAYNHRVVEQIDNLIYTFCPTGIYATNGVSSKLISEPVKRWLVDFKPQIDSQVNRVVVNTFATSYDKKYILYIGDTTTESDLEDVVLVYDTERGNWTVYQGFTNFKHLVGLKSFKYGGGKTKVEGLFGGDTSGKYYRFFSKRYIDGDNEQNSVNALDGDVFPDLISNTGVPVSSVIETQFYDQGNPLVYKQFRHFRVIADGIGLMVSCKVESDRGESNWIPLGATTKTNHQFELPEIAKGYRIKFQFSHVDSNSAPTLNAFVIENTDELSQIRTTPYGSRK